MKDKCPLLTGGLAQAPTLASLSITNERLGRAEPPRARGRAFQLTAEEARATLDVVTGMFPFITLSSYFMICLCL